MASSLVFSTQIFSILVIILLRIYSVHSQDDVVFDVTAVFDLLSKGTPDITKALQNAWNQACATNNSIVLIPNGIFTLNSINLTGPCNGSTTFILNGDLKAFPTKLDGDWVVFSNINRLAVMGNGTFDGQGASAWRENNCKSKLNCKRLPMSLRLEKITNALILGISSINSKFFHIHIGRSKFITIMNVTIQAPHNSSNTDGIHITESNDVTIQNSNIGTGDDCISLSPGSRSVRIDKVTCGPGHGISIGSLGGPKDENKDVSDIVVKNCIFTNTTNGARIKTWAPSSPLRAFNLKFEDIILNNVTNPILIDQHYCPNSHCKLKGESSVEILNVEFNNFKGTSFDKVAVTLNCSELLPCGADIVLRGLDISYIGGGPTTAVCSNFNGIFSDKSNNAPFGCSNDIAVTPVGAVETSPTPAGSEDHFKDNFIKSVFDEDDYSNDFSLYF